MKTAFEQVLNLKDSVKYQPDAVSRTTIMQQEGGSATLVALDGKEGEGHSTPFAAMIVVVEGEIEFTIEGTPHRVREESMSSCRRTKSTRCDQLSGRSCYGFYFVCERRGDLLSPRIFISLFLLPFFFSSS
jgi:hypothetical protein